MVSIGASLTPGAPVSRSLLGDKGLMGSSVDGEQYFQPTRAIGHHLSRIFGAPSFGEADANRIRIVGPQRRLSNTLIKVRLFIVKHLNTVTGRHSYHGVTVIVVIFII